MQATLQFVEKYYTDNLAEKDIPESRWASKWSKYVNGQSVLDVACGPYLYNDALTFSEIPKELVGTDINKANIDFLKTSQNPNIFNAKEILKNNGTDIQILMDDIRAERPEFLRRFDSIFASGIIGNFNESATRKVLKNFHSYLKSSGILVIVSWIDDYLNEEKLKERVSSDWYARQNLRPEEYSDLLRETSFSIEKQEVYKVPNPKEYEWGTIFGFVARRM